VERTLLFFIDPLHDSQAATDYLKLIFKPHSSTVLDAIISELTLMKTTLKSSTDIQWDVDAAAKMLKTVLEKLKPIVPGVKKPDVFQISRYAMAGIADGPEVPVMMGLVGLDKSIDRFESAKRALSSFTPTSAPL